MNDDEYMFILTDRLGVIRDTIAKYGADNFYVSFSGGRDSTVLSRLIDIAIPSNSIPRVFIDTGIEYNAIKEFVSSLASTDKRFVMVKPTTPIKPMLEKYGYPFKSKEHSLKIGMWQSGSRAKSIIKYQGGSTFSCPKRLVYQFDHSFALKLSNKCCYKLKKDPAKLYERSSGRYIAILGLKSDEGGERANHSGCVVYAGGGW